MPFTADDPHRLRARATPRSSAVVAVGERVRRSASRHASRGPQVRARVGLGVEAAVERVVVLRPARRAHREAAMVVAGRSYGTRSTIV